jgi:pumilio homology domain family member 6
VASTNIVTNVRLLAFESHKAQKELQSQRKAAKPNAVVMDQAKRIWASARQKDTPRAEREKLCKDLAVIVKGKVTEVVFKHDASRMIQTVSIPDYLLCFN